MKGIQLGPQLTESERTKLSAALLDRMVLVFKDQRFTALGLLEALQVFGQPMRQHRSQFNLPEAPDIGLIVNRNGLRPASNWHTDHTNHREPPKVTALYARALPSKGGATRVANMAAGFQSLPASVQARLRTLSTFNGLETDEQTFTTEDRQRHAQAVQHPLVRTHPESGRQALYFHVSKSHRVDGVEPSRTRAFLETLLDVAIKSDWIYTHHWQLNDLVLIDNRCTMHQVVPDYDPQEYRLLWRVILRGDRPYYADQGATRVRADPTLDEGPEAFAKHREADQITDAVNEFFPI